MLSTPKAIELLMHSAQPVPQKSLSSSNFVNSNGEVVKNSIYTDTNGNLQREFRSRRYKVVEPEMFRSWHVLTGPLASDNIAENFRRYVEKLP